MTNLITQPTNALEFMFEGNEVRVLRDEKGEPWFVAKDVAETLGYTDTDQAIRTHCKATKTYPVNSTGQVRNVKIIPERDVYRLVMRSKLEGAEKFEEWVVGEVLHRTPDHQDKAMTTQHNTKTKAVLQFTPDEARAESQRKEDMTKLMKIEQNLTMSTREIAELTGKRHDNVVVDTRKMLQELYGEQGLLTFQDTYLNEQNGQQYPMFALPKRETLILVSGYSLPMRAKIIDRWQELEVKVQKPMTQIELILATAQVLADVEKRLVATEEHNKQVQGTVAKHESKFLFIESGLEDIKNTNILDHCPTHAESITAIRERMNKLYGLSMKVVDEVMRQSPLSLKPAHTIRNTNPAAKGSSYFVYHVKDVNKVFALFASQAEMVSVGRYKHPFIEGNFKMNK